MPDLIASPSHDTIPRLVYLSRCRSRVGRKRWLCLSLLLPVLLLAGCVGGNMAGEGTESPPTVSITDSLIATQEPPQETATPVPSLDLVISEDDLLVEPKPLRAGFPFTVTTLVHNPSDTPAIEVPLMLLISAKQEKLGHVPYLQTVTVTVPASATLPVTIPVDWNFGGGEHMLWVQVNRLPEAWPLSQAVEPEAEEGDNMALLEVMVDPFDAYVSELCPGRTDVEIGPSDVLPEPDHQRVRVLVHNLGNRAAYNLPVVVLGKDLSGLAYTPAIPPCGGTTEVYVVTDRPFEQGESLTIMVNPEEWAEGLAEDSFQNNRLTVTSGLAPGMSLPASSGLDDYDFQISAADIESPEPWIVMVTARNQGTRDAAMVPIRVENEAGRQITDAIPLVQGEGLGVAAIRAGYLWIPGATLTFTINPEDAEGGYPEANRDDNVATFLVP